MSKHLRIQKATNSLKSTQIANPSLIVADKGCQCYTRVA